MINIPYVLAIPCLWLTEEQWQHSLNVPGEALEKTQGTMMKATGQCFHLRHNNPTKKVSIFY